MGLVVKIMEMVSYTRLPDWTSFSGQKDDLALYNTNEISERLTDMGNITSAKTSNTARQFKVTKLLSNPDVKIWFEPLTK